MLILAGTAIVNEAILTGESTPQWKSAKTNLNVEQVFFSIATDIKQRLTETDTKAEGLAEKYKKTVAQVVLRWGIQ
ncbi:ras-related protein RABE1d-like [Helianthus annuus]|uniref:ras-related protein RABE1d-like n=1 Tax=Helianthus annuus TaxID=4232 RepID=UPI000B8F9FE5|nr:ras-related protein RABE1d-like [Helianthus annuus]